MTNIEALEHLKYCSDLTAISMWLDNDVKIERQIKNEECYRKVKDDLEILGIIKANPELVWWCCCYKNAYEMIDDRKGFMSYYDMKEIERQFNMVKWWLENDRNNVNY